MLDCSSTIGEGDMITRMLLELSNKTVSIHVVIRNEAASPIRASNDIRTLIYIYIYIATFTFVVLLALLIHKLFQVRKLSSRICLN